MKTASGLSIAALELETGIGKDTLRVWERRYGFPQPVRDDHGERIYPPDQVVRLREVKRLLDQGMRPGKALKLTPEEIAAHMGRLMNALSIQNDGPLIELLKRNDPVSLRQELRAHLLREGLQYFITRTVSPMLQSIGHAWARGDIEIFEEHLFSEQLKALLHEAISLLPPAKDSPRVLLSTLTGEPHGLGMLLAHAMLRLEGAACISLGTQTPESQICAAARVYAADIAALSFSEYFPHGTMNDSVRRLRERLPAQTELWCGGGGARRLKRLPTGVKVIWSLDEISEQIGDWRVTRHNK